MAEPQPQVPSDKERTPREKEVCARIYANVRPLPPGMPVRPMVIAHQR